MRLTFSPLPVPEERDPRPLVDLVLEGFHEAPITCLVDTGSLLMLLPDWVADVIGVNLARRAERADRPRRHRRRVPTGTRQRRRRPA